MNMSSADQQYLQLIHKVLDRSITGSELDELYRLMAEDENKIDLYLFLTQSKSTSGKKTVTKETRYEISKQKFMSATVSQGPVVAQPIEPDHRVRKYTFPIAAVIIIFILAIGVTYIYLPPTRNDIITLVSAKGERKFYRLKDGTEIWLNGESQLEYNKSYGHSNRDVKLSGEAYFNVAKNKKLPFHVDSYGNRIEVLGTQFNVRAYPEEQKMETSLIEGKVNLQIKDNGKYRHYIMLPGDKIEVTNIMSNSMRISKNHQNTSSENTKVIIDMKKATATDGEQLDILWTKNKLVFQNDPLELMAKKMERWYNKTVVIENEKLMNESFTGVFEEKTCKDLLDLLIKTGVNLHYTEKQDSILIY
jgi:ferric-dicitrate binding protein FerR (iron transport regulator)